MPSPKLSAAAACRVARLDRVHLNEAISSGAFPCAPTTARGRTRYFDPDDMLALWLYREMIEDGLKREAAGRIACSVSLAARYNPEARAISYVENYFSGAGDAYRADSVPSHPDWDDTNFNGTDIRKVTTFRVGKTREMIAHYTEEERSHIGEPD